MMMEQSREKYNNDEGRPDDLIRLCDSLLQVLHKACRLYPLPMYRCPLPTAWAHGVVQTLSELGQVSLLQDEPEFVAQAEARSAAYKALRSAVCCARALLSRSPRHF